MATGTNSFYRRFVVCKSGILKEIVFDLVYVLQYGLINFD